jgi:3D (Asp-Asp-Asp) domain-containing protein
MNVLLKIYGVIFVAFILFEIFVPVPSSIQSKTFSAEALLAGEMRVTSYRSVPAQTKPKGYYWTSSGERCNVHGVAVSQDLLVKNGGFLKFNDVLYIEDLGYFHVNDTMNKRHKKRLDVWLPTYEDEKLFDRKFKRRTLKVWLIKNVMPVEK